MGCSTCGQRYTRNTARNGSVSSQARRSQIAARRAAIRTHIRGETAAMVNSPDESRAVVVQPDTPAGIPIPPNSVEVEPATGIAISVIKGGENPSKSLGDTEVKPITVTEGRGQGD